MEVLDLDNPAEFETFVRGNKRSLTVRGTNLTVEYDDMKRIGVTFSRLGASRAISAGAYAFALSPARQGLIKFKEPQKDKRNRSFLA